MKPSETIKVIRRGRAEAAAGARTRAEIDRHQHQQLHALLALAKGRCPFHERRLPRGRVSSAAALKDLPVMYKQDLAESFDLLMTDRRLTTSAIARHLQGVSGPDPLLLDGGCPVRRGSSRRRSGCDGYTVTGIRAFSLLAV